jgi:hypothetical protein
VVGRQHVPLCDLALDEVLLDDVFKNIWRATLVPPVNETRGSGGDESGAVVKQ